MRKVKHPEYPEYWIHEDGTVERAVDSSRYQKAGSILTGRVLVSGYRQHKLVHTTGVKRMVRANRLVAEAFHGTAPSAEHQSAHKNGVRLDNRADNLYWATPKENLQDQVLHGSFARGSKSGNSKLTEPDVIRIRAAYTGKRGEMAAMARALGVHETCVRKALHRETWAHVDSVSSALDQRGWP